MGNICHKCLILNLPLKQYVYTRVLHEVYSLDVLENNFFANPNFNAVSEICDTLSRCPDFKVILCTFPRCPGDLGVLIIKCPH